MTILSRDGRGNRAARCWQTCLAVCVSIAAVATSFAASPPRAAAKKPPTGVVTIILHPIAVAIHDDVSIGDVATVEGGDTALRTKIAILDLADAPELGKTTRLTPELIRHRIRIAGIDARRYKIQGADSVTLSSRGYQVP